MLRRSLLTSAFVLTGLLLAAVSLSAQKEENQHVRKFKNPPLASRIEVTVVRDANGKPVENAAVIFHPIEGDRDKGVMELKTNEEGKALIDVIPIGDTVRMQIIARGFQTTGEDFKVDRDAIHLVVRLKRPGQQYSIYRTPGQNSGAQGGGGSSTGAKPEPKPEPSRDQQQSK